MWMTTFLLVLSERLGAARQTVAGTTNLLIITVAGTTNLLIITVAGTTHLLIITVAGKTNLLIISLQYEFGKLLRNTTN